MSSTFDQIIDGGDDHCSEELRVPIFSQNHFDQGSLPGKIAAELHAAILVGEFPGGSQLKINDLAQKYSTSTMPIREALRQLSALGIVQLIPHRGAHVLELSLEDMRDTMEVRTLLEPTAVEQAARKGLSHETIALATQALSDMVTHIQSNNPQASRLAHEKFHFVLYGAAESPWLLRLIRMAWQNADRYHFAYPLSKSEQDLSDNEHRKILGACLSGDPETARETMVQHISRTCSRIEALLQKAKSESRQSSYSVPNLPDDRKVSGTHNT